MKNSLKKTINKAIEKNDVELIKKYIDNGGDVDNIILNESVLKGHLEMVQYAISLDINVNCEGGLPLRNACRHNHLEIVKILIEHGADINILRGMPLYIAVKEQHVDIVNYLLEKKANIFNEKENLSLIEISIPSVYNDFQNTCDIFHLLLPFFSHEYLLSKQESLLKKAIFLGNLNVIELLIELNPSQDIINVAFLEATNKTRSQEVIKLIFNYHPDINYQDKKESCYSMSNALSHLVAYDNEEMVNILLEKEITQENKERALRWGVYYNKKNMVEKLLSHQVNINTSDKEDNNYTPLIIALREMNEEMINFLLENGASIEQNKEEVIKIIVNNDSPDILILLMNYGLELEPILIKLIEEDDAPNLKEYIQSLIFAQHLNKKLEVKPIQNKSKL